MSAILADQQIIKTFVMLRRAFQGNFVNQPQVHPWTGELGKAGLLREFALGHFMVSNLLNPR